VADNAPVVHIGENSPEEVAYKLLKHIASVEKVVFNQPSSSAQGRGVKPATRKWILNTYAQCLEAVRGTGSQMS
jgi:hypothetical protein